MSLNFGFSLPALLPHGGGGFDPFNQSGPTLDLVFAGTASEMLSGGYTLNTNFIVPQYEIAAQYSVWENGVGMTGKSFSDIVTFTRASSATYFDSTGTLQTASTNVPRFDYNPATLAARGLLIEEARTNLLTYSEDLTQAAWNKTLGTVTVTVSGDATISPDGTVNADKVITANATGDHVIAQVTSVTSGTTYTQTWFLKAAELNWVQVTESTGFGSTQFQNIDLSNGTVGNGNYGSAVTITSVGNGWYRVSVTDAATATSASGRFLLALLTSDVAARLTDVTGNGTDGVYVWGAQLEAGAFPTSYIPTTTTATTRSADVASVNTLSPWYNAAAGTLFAEYTPYAVAPATAAQYVAMFSDGTVNNSIDVYKRANADVSTRFAVGVGGPSNQVFLNAGVFTVATNKIAAAYKTNDFAVSLNGGSSLTDPSGSVPTVSNLLLGSYVLSNAYLGGYLRRITYYPRRMPNAQLQTITT